MSQETVTIPKEDYEFMIECLKYFQTNSEPKDVSKDIDLSGFRDLLGMPKEEEAQEFPDLSNLDINNH